MHFETSSARLTLQNDAAALEAELARRNEIHVHFGCGGVNDPRFVNVDARPFPHVHLVTGSPELRAFRDASLDSLYACHVFEHFPIAHQDPILRRWLVLLKPGGMLRLSVPDFDKLVARYKEHGNDPACIQFELMGGQDYPGNFHYAIFNRRSLSRLLLNAGFAKVTEWNPRDEKDWPRDWSWAEYVSLNLAAEKQEA